VVVSDGAASRDFDGDVLDATVRADYGGTSVVLDLLGHWLLLVSGGGPTADKPAVTFGAPGDPTT